MPVDPSSPEARRLLREHVMPPRNSLRPLPRTDFGEDPGPGLDPAPRETSAARATASAGPVTGRGQPERRGPAPGRFARWLRASTEGRSWLVRAPLLPVLAWIAWRHAGDIWWGSVFSGINLAFHEIGHVLFGFLGSELLTIAGGTLLEVAVPVIAAALMVRQGDAYGAGVCVFWLGTALASVGRYIYDTRSQIFGRVSIGPYAGPDDWTYLLSRWDLIRQDRVIGMAVKEVGVAVMAAALVWCVFILWRMARSANGGGGGTGDAPGRTPTRALEPSGSRP